MERRSRMGALKMVAMIFTRKHLLRGMQLGFFLLTLICTVNNAVALNQAVALPPILTHAGEVHDLPASEASKALPVRLIATVTYYQASELFAEDASGAVYVKTTRPYPLHRGDLIEVDGVTAKSFRTSVQTNPRIRVIGTGPVFQPLRSDYPHLMSGAMDCRFVTIHGIIRSAEIEVHDSDPVAELEILMPGGIVQAFIQNYSGLDMSQLIDAEVELSGVMGGQFNARSQLMHTMVYAGDAQDLHVIARPKVSPLDIPETDINDVVSTRFILDRSTRVRVRGTVTYYRPGYSLVLQHAGKSLAVITRQTGRLPLGSVVDVIGFADDRRYAPNLEEVKIFPTGKFEKLAPVPVTYAQALSGVYSDGLVTMQGRIISELHAASADTMVVMVDDEPVDVVLQLGKTGARLPDLTMGSRVAVTGICKITPSGSWGKPLLFRLDMRERQDLEVIARPSWWTVAHLVIVIGALLAASIFIVGWAEVLRRKVAKQTRQIEHTMQVERERSRLLEEINSETPLPQLLENICTSIEALVPGVHCCVPGMEEPGLADAPDSPASDTLQGSLISESALTDSKGRRLGTFRVVSTDPGSGPGTFSEEQKRVLTIGASLASLAFNQRQMYQELNHLSTHDQLTELPNRRLSDARLDAAVSDARVAGTQVGVAYIDVDRFKQVNDRYGHRIGDLYLQQIADRLRAQVRASDMLARVGGDEFLLVASALQSPGDAEAYKLRLHSCFEESFVLDGIQISGSASIGVAMFPEHGTTSEELKRHADAAMYITKQCGDSADSFGAHSLNQRFATP